MFGQVTLGHQSSPLSLPSRRKRKLDVVSETWRVPYLKVVDPARGQRSADMSTTSLSAAPAAPRSPASSAQRTAEAKKAFIGSLNSAGASIDSELEARAKNIHANSKALTKQEEDLRKQTKAVAKESDSLQKLLDKTKKEVRGLGDLDSIMADLDADLAMIEETLRLAEESEAEHELDDSSPIQP